MKLLDFPFVKLTIFLVVGIVISQFIVGSLAVLFASLVAILWVLALFSFFGRNQFKRFIWIDVLVYVSMIIIGMLTVETHNQRLRSDHYSKMIYDSNHSYVATVKIREVLKPSAYHDKYIVKIEKLNAEVTSGKLLLNIDKDSIVQSLKVDDVILVPFELSEVKPPLNPYQFDYKKYLKKRYIEHQLYVTSQKILSITSSRNTILGYAANIRNKIDTQLKAHNFSREQLSIIDALLMGQKKDISPETYNSYVNAGVIHILAVSGLHVGIILLLLNRVFDFLLRLKHGRIVKIGIILILLWGFAALAGFSPSVTRAVGMFSVIAIAMNLKRHTNIYNTLAISMFLILLFRPMFLFEVGFQMSYMAVISIVSLKPIIASFWNPKPKLLNYYWQLLCVTLAAQIGVAPISLYYFHQFPALFFLSNLVILPFLGFILGFGILVIILALLDVLPKFVAEFYGLIIDLMNAFVKWVSQHEDFIFRNVSFGIISVILSYVLMVAVFRFISKQNIKRLAFVLISVLMMQGAMIFTKYRDNKSNKFVVFHKNAASLIAVKNGSKLFVGDNLDSISKRNDNAIRNYKIGERIDSIIDMELEPVYVVNDTKILVLDSLGTYNVKSFKPDAVLLRDSPKINLERVIDSLKPDVIIADGSNYKSYLARWKATCEKKKIPFHQTSEKGAYILKY